MENHGKGLLRQTDGASICETDCFVYSLKVEAPPSQHSPNNKTRDQTRRNITEERRTALLLMPRNAPPNAMCVYSAASVSSTEYSPGESTCRVPDRLAAHSVAANLRMHTRRFRAISSTSAVANDRPYLTADVTRFAAWSGSPETTSSCSDGHACETLMRSPGPACTSTPAAPSFPTKPPPSPPAPPLPPTPPFAPTPSDAEASSPSSPADDDVAQDWLTPRTYLRPSLKPPPAASKPAAACDGSSTGRCIQEGTEGALEDQTSRVTSPGGSSGASLRSGNANPDAPVAADAVGDAPGLPSA